MKAGRDVSSHQPPVWRRLFLATLAVLIAGLATLAAHVLHVLIALITQLAFFGRFSSEWIAVSGTTRGAWVILIPAVGGGVIALVARYGSKLIIGHGIPEVMQQVLVNKSRIAPRVAWLKPLSSAVSIGTGGPYGAEGPVIATGSAIGSLVGQVFTMTASERKILLAAGAAAGMTAIFGSPVAATLLALELLLFEFRARSILPVALASAFAQALRLAWGEQAALFPLASPGHWTAPTSSLLLFALIGVGAGVLAVLANTGVHRVERWFTHLPVHWMWCPVIGGLFVGLVGWREPRVLGAGYDVIGHLLSGDFPLAVVGLVCGLKLMVWVVSLGSGTSGGTLAPMLIIGGGVGALTGAICEQLGLPGASPGLAALAGMVAFFAGGSRAYFASIVLGVEITRQADVLWPVATAATASLAVAHWLSARSIMTSPVEQQGVRVPTSFETDAFAHVTVGEVMESNPRTISAQRALAELSGGDWGGDHGGRQPSALPVVSDSGALLGIITRKDVAKAAATSGTTVGDVMTRDPIVVYADESLHVAIERMHYHGVGRLPVVERGEPTRLVGYLGRAAILSARGLRRAADYEPEAGWISHRLRRSQD